MNLSEEVDMEDYVGRPDKISNADISAICQEAGMHAVRKNRYVILPKDFEKVGRFHCCDVSGSRLHLSLVLPQASSFADRLLTAAADDQSCLFALYSIMCGNMVSFLNT